MIIISCWDPCLQVASITRWIFNDSTNLGSSVGTARNLRPFNASHELWMNSGPMTNIFKDWRNSVGITESTFKIVKA